MRLEVSLPETELCCYRRLHCGKESDNEHVQPVVASLNPNITQLANQCRNTKLLVTLSAIALLTGFQCFLVKRSILN